MIMSNGETAVSFIEDLRRLINIHSVEGSSNTEDWILANYLSDCLRAFELAVNQRDRMRKGGPFENTHS